MHSTSKVGGKGRAAQVAAVLATVALACGESNNTNRQGSGGAIGTSGKTGSGGVLGSGGVQGTGGGGSTGGTQGSGGAQSTGGVKGTGGVSSTGGAQGYGGQTSTGGTTTTGGAQGTGGGSGTGGIKGTGGASGTGGAANTGGRTGTGGASATGGTPVTGGAPGTGGVPGTGGGTSSCGSTGLTYDQAILCEKPVAYLAMNKLSGSEPDLTGNNRTGTYKGGTAAAAALPNGDQAADFNGSSQYVTVPSNAVFSIPTTGSLTWEAWIRPAILQFPNDSGGYVDWMGKCADYAPTCEWEARMYNTTNSENRCNRISAYVFNSSAGLGSAADWQPDCGLVQAGQWYHVVGAYTLESQPSDCSNATTYPGSIEIWVNGVKWKHSSHGQTGCMSQYSVLPKANSSPVNIGTMAGDAWFQGAIAKVAFYDFTLTQSQVTAHFRMMTGKDPTGSCANTCSF